MSWVHNLPSTQTIPANKIYTSMNKTELVSVVQKALGKETSKAAAERSVNAVIEGIKKGIKKDKEVQLIGFGSFKVSKRAARKGINPADEGADQDSGFQNGEIQSGRRPEEDRLTNRTHLVLHGAEFPASGYR